MKREREKYGEGILGQMGISALMGEMCTEASMWVQGKMKARIGISLVFQEDTWLFPVTSVNT